MENWTDIEATLIQKEEVGQFSFADVEVLEDSFQVAQRNKELALAVQLGNAYKRKVKVKFRTSGGIMKVETTLWAMTEKHVVLKGGRIIPVVSILSVSIY